MIHSYLCYTSICTSQFLNLEHLNNKISFYNNSLGYVGVCSNRVTEYSTTHNWMILYQNNNTVWFYAYLNTLLAWIIYSPLYNLLHIVQLVQRETHNQYLVLTSSIHRFTIRDSSNSTGNHPFTQTRSCVSTNDSSTVCSWNICSQTRAITWFQWVGLHIPVDYLQHVWHNVVWFLWLPCWCQGMLRCKQILINISQHLEMSQ